MLMIGDIVGKLGRRTVATLLPELKREHPVEGKTISGERAG